MAYSAELAWVGSSGEHAFKTGPSYEAGWRVTTDNPLHQAQRVILWFRANEVELGDEYMYAEDNTGSIAIAKKIAARRELGTVDVWIVTVSYEPYDDKNDDPGRDNEGNPTDNPADWRPVISVRTNRYSVPVEKARYLTGFTGKTAARIAALSQIIPCNSSIIPFNPGLEKDQFNLQVAIKRMMVMFDATHMTRVINDRPVNAVAFQLNWYGLALRVLAREAKLAEFDCNFQRINGYDVWEVQWGFEVKDSDWIDEICDRGVHARAIPGDDDGRGGTIGQTDIIAGVPGCRRMVDFDETPVTDPVLLNGDGKPLDLSVVPLQPVWISYLKYEEENYLTLPFFQGILTPL